MSLGHHMCYIPTDCAPASLKKAVKKLGRPYAAVLLEVLRLFIVPVPLPVHLLQ